MTIAKADNPGVVLVGFAGLHDLYDTEVASSLVTESVAFSADGESSGLELGLDFVEQGLMSQWKPGVGSLWCRHGIKG